MLISLIEDPGPGFCWPQKEATRCCSAGLLEVGHSGWKRGMRLKRNLYFHYDTPLGCGVDTVDKLGEVGL
jgi:hypothetical protein